MDGEESVILPSATNLVCGPRPSKTTHKKQVNENDHKSNSIHLIW